VSATRGVEPRTGTWRPRPRLGLITHAKWSLAGWVRDRLGPIKVHVEGSVPIPRGEDSDDVVAVHVHRQDALPVHVKILRRGKVDRALGTIDDGDSGALLFGHWDASLIVGAPHASPNHRQRLLSVLANVLPQLGAVVGHFLCTFQPPFVHGVSAVRAANNLENVGIGYLIGVNYGGELDATETVVLFRALVRKRVDCSVAACDYHSHSKQCRMRAGPKGQIDTTPLDLSKLQHAGPKRVTAFIRASC